MFVKTKTCFPVTDFLDWASIDAIFAAGGCCQNDDCGVSFGDPCKAHSSPPGVYLNQVARLLGQAELKIKTEIGKPFCREFKTAVLPYPNNRPCAMKDKNGKFKTVRIKDPNYRMVASRGVESISESSAISYFDDDGDCFRERAVVTVVLDSAPSCSLLGLFGWFEDVDAEIDTDELYRIEPKKIEFIAATLTLTLTFDTRDLIKPSYLSVSGYGYKARKCRDLNLCDCDFDIDNTILNDDCALPQSINVYRIFEDVEGCNATMTYEGESRCACGSSSCVSKCAPACTNETGVSGMVRIIPAKYDDDSEKSCTCFTKTEVKKSCSPVVCFSCHYEPDTVRIEYVTGSPPIDNTLVKANGDMIALPARPDEEFTTAVYSLALKHLQYPCPDVGATVAASPTMGMASHSFAILHAVESLVDGYTKRRWESAPDPLNPISDRLSNVPGSFELLSATAVDVDGVTAQMERGKLTISRNLDSCVNLNNRISIKGYGRFWGISEIRPTTDGGTELDLYRRLT